MLLLQVLFKQNLLIKKELNIFFYFSFGLAKRNICIVSVLLDAAKNIESGLNANEYIVATLNK
jgi:hypothetical protein